MKRSLPVPAPKNGFEVLRTEFKKAKKNVSQKQLVQAYTVPQAESRESIEMQRPKRANWIRNDLKMLFKKDRSAVLLALNKDCNSFAFKGVGEMILLHGAVQVMGFSNFKLKKAYTVYSPSTESLLNVSIPESYANTLTATEDIIDLLDEINDWDMETLKKWIQDCNCAAIVLFKESSGGLCGIEDMMPVFKKILTTSKDSVLLPSFAIVNHNSNQDNHIYPEMNISDSYLANMKGLGIGSIHCVVGAKNSGKSSLARHLSNSILSRRGQVAYLDCDVGQPEFTPCGLVSLSIISDPLLGPPFTHLRIPEYARFIGSTSAKQDPDQYISHLLELVQIYQTKYQHLDLVVNTSGWIRGVGFDLLCHFLRSISPKNVIVLQEDPYSTLIECLHRATTKSEKKLYIIPHISVPEAQISRLKLNAADQRNLTMISYFMQISSANSQQLSHDLWNFTRPFTHQTPFSVPLSLISLKFLNSQVPFSQTFYALNGSVVGLVVDATLYHQQQQHPAPFCKLVPTHTPLHQSNCLGLGLVRSINMATRTLYLLTPVPLSLMARVDMLVRGSLECPVTLLTHALSGGKNKREVVGLPYTTSMSAEGVGASEIKTRHLGRKRLQQ